MSRPVEMMLARWPLLYPGSTGDCQGCTGDDGQGEDHAAEVARVRGKVIAPILEAEDMAHVFAETRRNYRDWTRSHPGPGGDLESVMSLEDRRDDALVSALGGHLEGLGERTLRAVLGGIDLKKIVRRSTLPYSETWPEESWHRISNLLADNELCNLAIIHHLATGEGCRGRIGTLAAWGFQYALDAYWDAGYYGQHSTKLEDIPE